MGITIHFTARVTDPSHSASAIAAAEASAHRRGWAAERFANANATLQRSDAGREWEYTGATTGVRITPHEACEPLTFEFDADGVCQDYVKTQFAGPAIHMAVVDLLRDVEPSLASLEVFDEGDYWNTQDTARVTGLFADVDVQLKQSLASDSKNVGPVQLENGRIVDLIRVDDAPAESRTPWWKFW